jgi:hypothetical protein
VTEFSEWTAGSHVGPTSVEVRYLTASNSALPNMWPWLIACAVLGSMALGALVTGERRTKQHR